MKRSISFIFVVVFIFSLYFIVLPYKTTSSEGTNLLYNGDFNEVETVDEQEYAVGWSGSYLKFAELSDGNYYARSNGSKDDLCLQQNGLNLEAGKYSVKFDARFAKTDGRANLTVGLRAGATLEDVTSKNKSIANYDNWTEVFFEFDLEESGVYQLYFKAELSGVTIHIDNMTLFSVNESGAGQSQDEVLPDEQIKAEAGAAIRMVKSSLGLRFKGSVDKKLYDTYVSQYGAANVQVGMIIAPTDYLSDLEFTFETLSKSKAVQVCVAEKWNNESMVATDGYYGFNCAFVNILPYNTDRTFSFRSFLKYNDGDNTTYLYSDYDETDNARSVYDVAVTAKEENSYVGEQLEVIEYFCDIIDYPTPNIIKNGNTFTLTFSGIKGYFALDYDRNAYSLSNVKITKEGDTEKDFGGMEFLAESTNLTLTLTVDTATTLAECPVRGRVYRID